MAVDGRILSDSLRFGSDVWIDFPCSPCAKDGKNVAAVKYCVECYDNLCSTCLTHHNKFAVMRSHQITDKLSSRRGKKRPDLHIKRCDKHGWKLVDLYCSRHDSVGCSACKAVDHSACKKMKYIPDLTNGTQLGNDIFELETKLKRLSTRLDQLKKQKQDRLKHLQQEKEKLMKEIRVLRKQINDKLDKMEKALVDDVNLKFDAKIQTTNRSIDTIDNMKASVETSQKNIQEAKQSNEVEIFVQMKRGNSCLQINETRSNSLRSDRGVRSMKLLPSNDIKKLLEQGEISLGHISEILVAKSTAHHGDFSVSVRSDKSNCRITDMCLTKNGSVIITDHANRCIKKLNDSYAVIEHLDMADYPTGLCEVDSTQLAVALLTHKKVQFVFQQPLKLGYSFPVRDRCRGITCLYGQLYVCCGGRREKGEGPGHIEVYKMTGDLLRTFYEGLSFPVRISATRGHKIFISDDNNQNLNRVSMSGCLVSEIHINKLSCPVGFCRIGDGQLCVTGRGSDNIVLISEDGGEEEELLTKEDGILNPYAVCFDEKHSRLIVTCNSLDFIKVYNVLS